MVDCPARTNQIHLNELNQVLELNLTFVVNQTRGFKSTFTTNARFSVTGEVIILYDVELDLYDAHDQGA